MKRRSFIKKAAFAAASTIAAPYIIPSSNRLFAQSTAPIAEHVIFVLFAGGVRHQEAAGQHYLYDSQFSIEGISVDFGDINPDDLKGNIMPNMLVGQAPSEKIVYGCTPPPGSPDESIPISPILQPGNTMQEQGILFKEMTCALAGHYGGQCALITGRAANTQGLRQKPLNPTIFEYARKHLGLPASKVWFVGNGLGNSIPLLNYSSHANYGAAYGANMFVPSVTFGGLGVDYLSYAKNYHLDGSINNIYEMKGFLDNSFLTTGRPLPNIGNTPAEKDQIQRFMKRMFEESAAGLLSPLGCAGSNDTQNLLYASEIFKEFKPNVMAVNMGDVDGCHSSFTGYVQALHRADFGIGYLWSQVMNLYNAGEIGETAIIIAPEHGRDTNPNIIVDENNFYAYDHSDGTNTPRSFAMMVGTPGTYANISPNLALGANSPYNPDVQTVTVGSTEACMLTGCELLGIRNAVSAEGLVNNTTLFDYI